MNYSKTRQKLHLGKSKSEIELIKQACHISALAMEEVKKHLNVGMTTLEIDQIVEEIFKKHKASSAFKRVNGYKYSICATPNDWVVHGIPDKVKLKSGDIVGIDLGAYFKGYNSDMADTFIIGQTDSKVKEFLEVGEKTLWKAINQARIGNHIGDISATIQENIEGVGYSVVKELVGHGVGRELHEDPMIPGRGKKGSGPLLEEGLVLAIEIIYNQGKPQIVLLDDGWTIATKDSSLAGLFERTILVTNKGPVVLTAV